MKTFFLRLLVLAVLLLAGVSSLVFLSGTHTTFAAAPAVTSQAHPAAQRSTLQPAICTGAIVTTFFVNVTCYGPGSYSLSGVTQICATTNTVTWNGAAIDPGACENFGLDAGTLSV